MKTTILYTCLICGRDQFTKRSPHNCVGGFRKRGLRWTCVRFVKHRALGSMTSLKLAYESMGYVEGKDYVLKEDGCTIQNIVDIPYEAQEKIAHLYEENVALLNDPKVKKEQN